MGLYLIWGSAISCAISRNSWQLGPGQRFLRPQSIAQAPSLAPVIDFVQSHALFDNPSRLLVGFGWLTGICEGLQLYGIFSPHFHTEIRLRA